MLWLFDAELAILYGSTVCIRKPNSRRLSPSNALRIHRSARLQLDSLTGGYSVVFCAIIVYITLDSTPTGSRIIQKLFRADSFALVLITLGKTNGQSKAEVFIPPGRHSLP